MVDIVGTKINIGDIVVAPFGKDYAQLCEVVKVNNVLITVKVIKSGNMFKKHGDSVVVVDFITNKLNALGL